MIYKPNLLALLRVKNQTFRSSRKLKGILSVLAIAAASIHISSLQAVANVTFSLTITEDDINDNNNGDGDGDGGTGPGDPDPNAEACLLEVLQAGAFGLNTAGDTLDSRLAGGTSGLVRVTSTKPDAGSSSGFQLSLDAPGSFSEAPSGGNTATTISAFMSGSSVTNGVNFPERPGDSPVTLPDTGTSVTQLTADLSAFKSDGPYPAGSYTAIAVVRCE